MYSKPHPVVKGCEFPKQHQSGKTTVKFITEVFNKYLDNSTDQIYHNS